MADGADGPCCDWLDDVRALMEEFAAATPGAVVEVKSSSVAWHYRLAGRGFGRAQARELRLALSRRLVDCARRSDRGQAGARGEAARSEEGSGRAAPAVPQTGAGRNRGVRGRPHRRRDVRRAAKECGRHSCRSGRESGQISPPSSRRGAGISDRAAPLRPWHSVCSSGSRSCARSPFWPADKSLHQLPHTTTGGMQHASRLVCTLSLVCLGAACSCPVKCLTARTDTT